MKDLIEYMQESILSSTKTGSTLYTKWLEEKWLVSNKNIKLTNDGIILGQAIRFNVIDLNVSNGEWKKVPKGLKIIPGTNCNFYFRENESQLDDFDLSEIINDKKPSSLGFYDFKDLSIPEWLYKMNLKKLTLKNCKTINNLKLDEISDNCIIAMDEITTNCVLQNLFEKLKFESI